MLHRQLIQLTAATCFLAGLTVDIRTADAQLFRRFRQSRAQQQYRPPTQTQSLQPTRQIVQPNVQIVQPSTTTIAPQAGQQVVRQTLPTNSGQQVRLPLYRDARTGKLVALDPRTGRQVAGVTNGQIFVDPQTRRPYVLGTGIQQSTQIAGNQITVSPSVSVARPSITPNQTPTLAAPLSGADEPRQQPDSESGGSILAEPVTQNEIRPTLGIQVSEQTDGIPGISVNGFKQHSFADESGLRIGDRVYSINGVPTRTVQGLASELAKYKAGEQVVLRIGRGNRLNDIRVPLVDHPDVVAMKASKGATLGNPTTAGQPSQTGLANIPQNGVPSKNASSRIEPVLPGSSLPDRVVLGVDVVDVAGKRGVVVTEVNPRSPASNAGLAVGDRIVSIDGRLVTNSESLAREVTSRKEGDSFSLQIVRSNQLVTSNIKLVSTSTQDLGGSVLSSDEKKPAKTGGFGSIIGGLFGRSGSGDSEQKPQVAAKSDSASDSGVSILQQPSDELSLTQPNIDSTSTELATDEMAFGDSEPIQETVFDSAPIAAAIPEAKVDEQSRRKSAEVVKLQSEIDRLKVQLEKAKRQ